MIDDATRARLVDTRGLIEEVDGERLAQLASLVDPSQAIVEVGSHTGLSSCWMASGSQGAHVFCVDPFPNPRPQTPDWNDDPFELGTGDNVLAEFWANLDRFGYRDRITPLRGASLDVAAMWIQPTGLVFIDAMHDYGDALNDAQAWGPKVAPGGWIAFHDWFDDPERTYESQVADAIRDSIIASGDFDDGVLEWNLWTARRR